MCVHHNTTQMLARVFLASLTHTIRWEAGTIALTFLVRLEGFLRFVPHGLAVLHESVVAGLLPGRGADLEEVSPLQEELQVRIALHTCEIKEQRVRFNK